MVWTQVTCQAGRHRRAPRCRYAWSLDPTVQIDRRPAASTPSCTFRDIETRNIVIVDVRSQGRGERPFGVHPWIGSRRLSLMGRKQKSHDVRHRHQERHRS